MYVLLREVSVRIVFSTMQTIYDNCTYTKIETHYYALHIFSATPYARLVHTHNTDTHNCIIVSIIDTGTLGVLYI